MNKAYFNLLATGLCAIGSFTVLSSANAQVTLIVQGVSPFENVTLQVGAPINIGPEGAYAGVYNLLVDGVPTPSFCIDVARDVFAGQVYTDYSYADLAVSPLAPSGPMGPAGAVDIEKLWAAYFPAATGNSQDAAALQAAIWLDIASHAGYTVTVNGNNLSNPVYAEAAGMLSSLPSLTAQANLVGLVSPSGQNYVIEVVPEPSTMALAGLGGLGLLLLRRQKA